MSKTKLSIFIFTFLAFVTSLSAQDTLTLITGKTVLVEVDSITDNLIYFQLINKNKRKSKVLEKESVFSIVNKAGEEQVFYKTNPDEGFELSETEMRYYIYGAQDANKGYKNPWVTVIGMGIGGGLGYVLSEEFYVAAIPFGYTLLVGSSGVNYNEKSVRNPDYRKSEAYQSGYFKTARSRKIKNAVVGSVIGTGIGIALGSELK